ncbi:hypothetical protein GGF32_004709 [Allomyces javanicus]|nr:hypothetical protein GGF32_004709 [Allomyces javanicus]
MTDAVANHPQPAHGASSIPGAPDPAPPAAIDPTPSGTTPQETDAEQQVHRVAATLIDLPLPPWMAPPRGFRPADVAAPSEPVPHPRNYARGIGHVPSVYGGPVALSLWHGVEPPRISQAAAVAGGPSGAAAAQTAGVKAVSSPRKE